MRSLPVGHRSIVAATAAAVLLITGTLLAQDPGRSSLSGEHPHAESAPPDRSGGGASLHAAAGTGAANDSAAVVEVVDRFHRALATGDSAAALALLTPDAIILESGGVETRDEYRSHHLPGDIAFARAVPRERGPIRVSVRGDAAWATSTSVVQGRYRDRDINSASVELMVLVRTPEGWRIAAIHWSSRNRR